MSDSASIAPEPDTAPGYEEPWQAQAFACAMRLCRAGLFSQREWTLALSREIQQHPALPHESALAAYYRQLLDTLEGLIREKGAISGAELAERADAWREAYLHTPHGQAVELQNACRPHPRTPTAPHGAGHRHGGERRPVAVSPARD